MKGMNDDDLMTANNLGSKEALSVSEMLKMNTTLTSLDMSCEDHFEKRKIVGEMKKYYRQ